MPASPSRTAAGSRKGPPASSSAKNLPVKVASHRFREARGKILRQLGQGAHTWDAQFAILWVGPEGRAEVYASEALQGGLKTWLDDGVQRDAEERTRALRDARDRRAREGLEVLHGGDIFSGRGEVFDPAHTVGDMECSGDEKESNPRDRVVEDADEFLLPIPPGPFDKAQPSPVRDSAEGRSMRQDLSTPARSNAAPVASTSRLARSLGPNSSLPSVHPSPVLPSSPVPPAFAATSSSSSGRFVRRTFTPDQLDDWFSERFNELWQKVDKSVCKAWIKTVEPNKSTRFQYQKGDEHKPEWWPREIRHKEPDHLTKPERITLLMHLLRRGPVAIDDLELATAAVSALIPQDKMSILHEIYRIAKEEKAAIDASPDGKFEQLTVALEVSATDLDDLNSPGRAEPKQHNTRHRARRSIGQAGDLSASQGSPSSHLSNPASQQTPRASNRLQPYPLARSNSVSDAQQGRDGGARSPAPGASGMSRSQSLVGPVTSAGRPRIVSGSRRDVGKGALDEADQLGPNTHATPYAARKGGKPATTPARAGEQGSPLAAEAAAMGRSYSTSAVGGGGGGGGSSTKKAPRVFDDAVASPAMLKSRSRLSQQHFEQMMHRSSPGEKPQRGAPRQQPPPFPAVHEQPHQQQLPAHFQLHQHHQHQLAQMQAQAHAQAQVHEQQHLPHQRPPMQHAHSHPLPQPHQRAPSHPHQQHQQQQFAPAQQVLVYGPFPNGSSPSLPPPAPQLVRQLSGQSARSHSGMHPQMRLPSHHHLHAQQESPVLHQQGHFSPSPHLPQLPPPPHLVQAPQGHAHAHAQGQGHGHPHAVHHRQHQHQHQHHQQHHQPPTQVQVQVQVHAGHHQPHPHPSAHGHMQRGGPHGEYDAYGPPSAGSGAGGAGAYPTPGSWPSPHFPPAAAPAPALGPAQGSESPFLLPVGGGGGSAPSGAGTPQPQPQPPHSAGTQDGFLVPPPSGPLSSSGVDSYSSAGAGAGEYGAADEWTSFVDQPLERLGLGVGVGVDTTMGFEPGYYGGEGDEDEYGLLGMLGTGDMGGAAEEDAGREHADARRRYEEHTFGIVGA